LNEKRSDARAADTVRALEVREWPLLRHSGLTVRTGRKCGYQLLAKRWNNPIHSQL
jgi:hypothetical protein